MTDTTELQAENDKLRALCGKLSALCEQADGEYLEDAVRRVLAERNGLRDALRSIRVTLNDPMTTKP